MDYTSVLVLVCRLVRRRSRLLAVGRWARLSYRVLFSGYGTHYFWRYSLASHNPGVFRLLGRVLAGLIVPLFARERQQAQTDINTEIRLILSANLPDFAAARISSFLGRGGGS